MNVTVDGDVPEKIDVEKDGQGTVEVEHRVG